jgi:hypothetical protein
LNGAYFDSSQSAGLFSKRRAKPALGTAIEVDQQVGGAELCRFSVEAAAITQDAFKLRQMLASTRDHYVKYEQGEASSSKYQFIDPKRILIGSIRSFRDKP